MKRTVIGIVVVTGLTQVTGPAQAAPGVDPVKAVEAALQPGRTVTITSTAKTDHGRGLSYTTSADGTIGFGPQDEIAADLSQSIRFGKKASKGMKDDLALAAMPLRIISSGEDDYVSGALVDAALPQEKRWVRYRATNLPASNRLLDVLDKATLRALVAHRTSWRDGVLRGTITTGELVKVSRPFVSRFGLRSKSGREGKVSYVLRLGPTGLVERLSAEAVLPFYDGSIRVEADTRYSGWGRRATVLLPREGDVIDGEELGDELPYPLPGWVS
ncbi:hypothetical protein ABGB14_41695 [Nonomuraea sp. B10E15]|uniref:hypothetical protein n=1 Tax=Nonomuraea sp. B10E15 TaxID=3153560 RepID=UPI00325E4BE1